MGVSHPPPPMDVGLHDLVMARDEGEALAA